MKETLLLDFDGVVADTLGIKNQALAYLLKNYTNDFKWINSFIKLTQGLSRKEKLKLAIDELRITGKEIDLTIQFNSLVSNFLSSTENLIDKAFIDFLMRSLSKNRQLCIFSNAPVKEIKGILMTYEIFDSFHCVSGHEDGPKIDRFKNLDYWRIDSKSVLAFVGDTQFDECAAKEAAINFIGFEGLKHESVIWENASTITASDWDTVELLIDGGNEYFKR